jgi:hypothetical protein
VSEPFIGTPLTSRRMLMNPEKKAATSKGNGFLNKLEKRFKPLKEIDNNAL